MEAELLMTTLLLILQESLSYCVQPRATSCFISLMLMGLTDHPPQFSFLPLGRGKQEQGLK